ncbi:MAG TPA: YkvA family protein [Polyangiaceae bacterium]|nr:YkvA family protein [Polyangiaceae bacterium]
MDPSASLELRHLDAFQSWLRTLGEDAARLLPLLEVQRTPAVRSAAAKALVYLVKSVDLIPDGLQDLGYLDDAFVLRVALEQCDPAEREGWSEELAQLVVDAALVGEFLATNYARLTAHVTALQSVSARGRSVEQVLTDASEAEGLAEVVRAFAREYAAPSLPRDAQTLVKLRAFFATKLPQST